MLKKNLLLAVVASVVLAACGSANNNNEGSDEQVRRGERPYACVVKYTKISSQGGVGDKYWQHVIRDVASCRKQDRTCKAGLKEHGKSCVVVFR